jgi:hypothetical protein
MSCRFGFHQPPFNSVDHLHLHCLALPFMPRYWNCRTYHLCSFLYVASTIQKSLWDYISNYLHSSSLQLEASKIYTVRSPGGVYWCWAAVGKNKTTNRSKLLIPTVAYLFFLINVHLLLLALSIVCNLYCNAILN